LAYIPHKGLVQIVSPTSIAKIPPLNQRLTYRSVGKTAEFVRMECIDDGSVAPGCLSEKKPEKELHEPEPGEVEHTRQERDNQTAERDDEKG